MSLIIVGAFSYLYVTLNFVPYVFIFSVKQFNYRVKRVNFPALWSFGRVKLEMSYSTLEMIWNANLMQQGNFIKCILSSTCFGHIRPSSGASDVELQHMVFCTEFLDGWWSWEPLCRSCVRCGWCRRTAPSAQYTRPTQRLSRPPSIQKLGPENYMLQPTSNAPDDGRMYPKHVELRIHQ